MTSPRATNPAPPKPEIACPSAAAWAKWLAENHARSSGVGLKIAKKGSGIRSVTYSDALDVALCYGWIDGQKTKIDESSWRQSFGPRTATSRWSKRNRERVARLIESNAMQPAGQSEIERAQADGRWDAAYDSPRTATVPDDLRAALAEHPRAVAFFATLDSRNRYAILYRIQDAKKPETRARRIEKFVAMLDAGEKIHA